MFRTATRYTALRSASLFTASVGVSACPKRRTKQSNPESGEDAYFIKKTDKSIFAGVFDGVGGWADSGVDPSIFSAGLAKHCHSSTGTSSEILIDGYNKLQRDAEVKMGSSTACVASVSLLDASTTIANLGDSGYLIADRHGDIVYESTPQTYFFNAPYQLAKMPDSMRKPGSLENKPEDADLTEHSLAKGGFLILGTDGFFDNVFAKDAERIIKSSMKEGSTKIAQALVQEAVNNGRSRKNGPFAAEALRHRLRYAGGKEDDVVIIVICVDPTKAKL